MLDAIKVFKQRNQIQKCVISPTLTQMGNILCLYWKPENFIYYHQLMKKLFSVITYSFIRIHIACDVTILPLVPAENPVSIVNELFSLLVSVGLILPLKQYIRLDIIDSYPWMHSEQGSLITTLAKIYFSLYYMEISQRTLTMFVGVVALCY